MAPWNCQLRHTPNELWRLYRKEIIEGRITQRDVRRWMPWMNPDAFAEFFYTGRVRTEGLLIRLDTAWWAYSVGRLKSARELRAQGLTAQGQPSRRGKGYRHKSDPTDPAFDIERERKLAARRLISLTRKQTDSLGVSQSTVQKCRDGQVPRLRLETVMKILAQRRSHGFASARNVVATGPVLPPSKIGYLLSENSTG